MTTSIEIPDYVATTASYRHGDLLLVTLGIDEDGAMVIGTHDRRQAADTIDLYQIHVNGLDWAPGPTPPASLTAASVHFREDAPAWSYDEVAAGTHGAIPVVVTN